MFKGIPNCFKDLSEDYFTKPSLQMFCKENELNTSEDKYELISSIETFGMELEDNEEKVLMWVEDALKEGVKHIILRKCIIPSTLKNKSMERWEEFLKTKLKDIDQTYLIGSKHKNEITCLSYILEEDNDIVNKICFTFSILLDEIKSKDAPAKTIIYPIFVDLDLKNGYVVARAKSKSNMYKYTIDDNGEHERDLEKANAFNLMIETIDRLVKDIELELESIDKSRNRFSKYLYEIISECTQTPKDIDLIVKKEEECVKNFIEDFFERNSINEISNNNFQNAKEDMSIFIEKYLAINIGNIEIFKDNRYAYPIKIAATDSELSSIEESTFNKRPLQATAMFYDNKKVLTREKKCDKVSLLFKREKRTYITNDYFLINFEVKRGYCLLQSSSYLLEGEIQNVLSRVIRN